MISSYHSTAHEPTQVKLTVSTYMYVHDCPYRLYTRYIWHQSMIYFTWETLKFEFLALRTWKPRTKGKMTTWEFQVQFKMALKGHWFRVHFTNRISLHLFIIEYSFIFKTQTIHFLNEGKCNEKITHLHLLMILLI